MIAHFSSIQTIARTILAVVTLCALLPALAQATTGGGPCPDKPSERCWFYSAGQAKPALIKRAHRDKPRALSEIDAKELQRWKKKLAIKELPGLRIGWYRNDTMRAYLESLQVGKPLVLFFHAPNCAVCNRLLDRFSCPVVGRFAGRAVFAMSMAGRPQGGDFTGRQLFDAAKGKAFPFIIVLSPDRKKIHIIGTALGEIETGKLVVFLEDALRKVPGAGTPATMLSVEAVEAEHKRRGLAINTADYCRS